LWCTGWHWDRYLSEHLKSFPSQYHFSNALFSLICHQYCIILALDSVFKQCIELLPLCLRCNSQTQDLDHHIVEVS
jgi:hypothetical protein